jgi:glycerophosphoryl diester phosphodiesterase
MRKLRPAKVALYAAAVAVSGLALLPGRVSVDPRPQPARPPLIAHAGGGVAGVTYSNSREALDHSYGKGLRLFEIDLSWTTDGHLVMVHDWQDSSRDWFPDVKTPLPLEEFKASKMTDGLTQMTLEDLYAWLETHEDAYVVTDVKTRNLDALRVIAETAGELEARFIPQIYDFSEFAPARGLGFEDVIFTVYRSKSTPLEVFSFGMSNELFAVTLPEEWALALPLARLFEINGVFVYAHTVNSLDIWRELRAAGVSGIYTDYLTPADLEGPAGSS